MSRRPARPQDAALSHAAAPLSARNRQVLRLRRLNQDAAFRRADGAFVAEGPKLVSAALDAGAPVEALYVVVGARPAVAERAAAAAIPVHELEADVFGRVADAVTPQPVLAVVGRVDVPLEQVRPGGLVLVCVDVRDPGNLGAILRSAEATGTGAVVCCKGTVDVYNPKCVRATAGAMFHLPVVAGGEPGQVLETLCRRGWRRLAAAAAGGTPCEGCDLTAPTAIVLGNEGHGLPSRVAGLVDGVVTIPMSGSVESLNVSVAAAVLCFEAARQRRAAREGAG